MSLIPYEEPIEEANERSTPTSTLPQYNWADEPYGLAHSAKWHGRIDMMHHVTITGIPEEEWRGDQTRLIEGSAAIGSLSACFQISLNMVAIRVTIMKGGT